jgi:hypothetical protein
MKSRGGFTKPNEALGIEESKDGLMDVTPKAGSAPPLPLSLEAFGETIQGHGKTLLRRFLAIGVGRAHTLPPPISLHSSVCTQCDQEECFCVDLWSRRQCVWRKAATELVGSLSSSTMTLLPHAVRCMFRSATDGAAGGAD